MPAHSARRRTTGVRGCTHLQSLAPARIRSYSHRRLGSGRRRSSTGRGPAGRGAESAQLAQSAPRSGRCRRALLRSKHAPRRRLPLCTARSLLPYPCVVDVETQQGTRRRTFKRAGQRVRFRLVKAKRRNSAARVRHSVLGTRGGCNTRTELAKSWTTRNFLLGAYVPL